MTERDDLALARWLAEGPERGSSDGLSRALAATSRTRQRTRVEVRLHWLAGSSTRPDSTTPPGLAIALVVIALLLAALVALALVGARRPSRLELGPGANGLLAYTAHGTVFVADPVSGAARAITDAGSGFASPAFSPDGTRIAFWAPIPGLDGHALFVGRADGSELREVSRGMNVRSHIGYSPGWSPDGSRLVFASNDGGVLRLYVVPSDGSAPPTPITGRDASRWAPVWSPDGQWIAFGQQTGGASPEDAVAVVRPDGSGERILHRQPVLPDEGAFAESLSWAPDSTRVAYMRGHDASSGPGTGPPDDMAYLAFAGFDTIEHRLYTEPSGWLHLPMWSSDGRWLLFVTGETSLTVRVVGAGGDDPRPIAYCDAALDDLLRWSPDARWVVVGCPGAPALISVGDWATVPLALPPGATSLDWQRVAP